MSSFSYVTDANIKRFQNLLDTSTDNNERQMLLKLLAEEKAKAETTDTTDRQTGAGIDGAV